MRLTLYVTLSQSDISESQERSGQNVIQVTGGSRGEGGGEMHWHRGRSYGRRVSYDATTHISDLSLKLHKQDGSILETGRPKVSNI